MFLIVLSAFVLIGALTAAVPTWAAVRRAADTGALRGHALAAKAGLI